MKELERIIKLTRATPEDVKTLFELHKKYLDNDFNYCASCPSNVRLALRQLQGYYKKSIIDKVDN